MGYRKSEAEHREQVAVIEWAEVFKATWPELEMLYAIPNGGDRDARVGAKMKREGSRKGVLDLDLPVPKHRPGTMGKYYAGCRIEMKAGKNKPTKEQNWWAAKLTNYGHACYLCYSATEAIGALTQYCKLQSVDWNN